VSHENVVCIVAAGSGVGYKAFTLILSGCVTDKRTEEHECNGPENNGSLCGTSTVGSAAFQKLAMVLSRMDERDRDSGMSRRGARE